MSNFIPILKFIVVALPIGNTNIAYVSAPL